MQALHEIPSFLSSPKGISARPCNVVRNSALGGSMNKRGFTLIELLVYIVIATIIVGIAGQAFLDATKLRMRTTRLLETSMGTSDVMGYLEEDVRRMGLKASIPPGIAASSGAAASSASGLSYAVGVYWNISSGGSSGSMDSSSFDATPGSSGSGALRKDDLKFRTAVFSSGSCSGWEEVEYSVDVLNQLNRKSTHYDLTNAASSSTSTVMANNVKSFKVEYGVWQLDSTIYYGALQADCGTTGAEALPAPNKVCIAAASSPHPSVSPNFASSGSAQVTFVPLGELFNVKMKIGPKEEQFDLTKGATYRVQFGIGLNDSGWINYLPHLDYMGVQILTKTGAAIPGIPDFQFYSSMDHDVKDRVFEISPQENAPESKLQFRFQTRSSSSGMADAAFTFDSVRIAKIAQDTMHWRSDFPSDSLAIKRLVKSVKISISVDVKGTVSSMTRVIPVPNNGVVK